MNKCNCQGCTDRTIGCHAICESYLVYAADRERVRNNKFNNNVYNGYIKLQSDKACRIHFANSR